MAKAQRISPADFPVIAASLAAQASSSSASGSPGQRAAPLRTPEATRARAPERCFRLRTRPGPRRGLGTLEAIIEGVSWGLSAEC